VKPSITIDDRGVLFHIPSKDQVVSIPLSTSTIREVKSVIGRARAALKTTEGRSTLAKGLGRLLSELTKSK
jgi:hypothetical protein